MAGYMLEKSKYMKKLLTIFLVISLSIFNLFASIPNIHVNHYIHINHLNTNYALTSQGYSNLNNVNSNHIGSNIQKPNELTKSTILSSLEYNSLDKSKGADRQLNKQEISLLQNADLAKTFLKTNGNYNPTQTDIENAMLRLGKEALVMVDYTHANKLLPGGLTADDKEAREFLTQIGNGFYFTATSEDFKNALTYGNGIDVDPNADPASFVRTVNFNDYIYDNTYSTTGGQAASIITMDKIDSITDITFSDVDNFFIGLGEGAVNIAGSIYDSARNGEIIDDTLKIGSIMIDGTIDTAKGTYNYFSPMFSPSDVNTITSLYGYDTSAVTLYQTSNLPDALTTAAVIPVGIAAKTAGKLEDVVDVGKTLSKSGVDKWIRTPNSLQDKMVLDAAKNGAGTKIIDNLGDDAFKGMEKWEYKVKSAEGHDTVVHYVRDPKTGELMDFKFKKQSTDNLGKYEKFVEGGLHD
jgi:hypothetical protein